MIVHSLSQNRENALSKSWLFDLEAEAPWMCDSRVTWMCDSRVTCTAGTVGVWTALHLHSQLSGTWMCEHLRSETATASHDQYPGVGVMSVGQISLEKEEVVGSSIFKEVDGF